MTGSGPGPSISEGSLAASQQDKLWVVDTLPTQWTRPVQTAAGARPHAGEAQHLRAGGRRMRGTRPQSC